MGDKGKEGLVRGLGGLFGGVGGLTSQRELI